MNEIHKITKKDEAKNPFFGSGGHRKGPRVDS